MFSARFTVQTPLDTTSPNISVLSPENKAYAVTEVPLTFTVDESASWMAYSLDNEANITITGNTTLSGLPNGPHSIIVYASDTAGNTGASEIIHFSIETPEEDHGYALGKPHHSRHILLNHHHYPKAYGNPLKS